ncbi:MAG TPA: hypothetical protein VF704_13575 [Allosphingosinicella sp.]|jgi:hypothetical protein
MSDIDLSGKWSGFFNYPVALPPVNFEAVLNDVGGRLTGSTSEPDRFGRTIGAVIDGSRQGASVTFIKMYDAADGEYDVVRYAGTAAAGGDEIEGRWVVAENWSGTFLMVRGGRAAEAMEQKAEEPV